MPLDLELRKRHFRIELTGADEGSPPVPQVAAFLHDFNILYEILRLAVDPAYKPRRFDRYLTYRNRRRVRAEDQLRTLLLRVESPLELEIFLNAVRLPATIGALALFLKRLPEGIHGLGQAYELVEKVRNSDLNRRLLAAQVEEAEQRVIDGQLRSRLLAARVEDAELKVRRLRALQNEEAAERLLLEEEALDLVEWASYRLKSDEISVAQLKLKFEDEEPGGGEIPPPPVILPEVPIRKFRTSERPKER